MESASQNPVGPPARPVASALWLNLSLARNLERLLVLGFSIVSLLLVGIGALSLRDIAQLGRSIVWVDHTHDALEMFDDLELDLREAEAALRAYFLTGDLAQREEYRRQAYSEMQEHLAGLRRLAQEDPTQLAELDRIAPLMQQRVSLMDQALTGFEKEPANRAQLSALNRAGTQLSDTIVARMDRFEAGERRLLAERQQHRTADAGFTRNVIIAGSVLGPLLAGLASLAILRGLRRRRETEAQLHVSLEEKEVLLKEVHHRVKNNLQVISSLLSLEAEKLEDAAAIAVFKECRDRIHSIARLHQQIYSGGQFSQIDFGRHLQELTGMLVHAHAPPGCRIEVAFKTGLAVDLDTAVTLNLIANELLLNCLKHGFRGRAAGHLSVQLHDTDPAQMIVSDDGIGLPPAFDKTRSAGLGIELVLGLSRQIRGTARIERGPKGGTCVTIEFPKPNPAL